MNPSHHLGELQYAIMRVLWSRGEATVSEVRDALADERERAPTTIATMLKKMEKKGVVAHRADGRLFVYRPTVTEPQVHRTMVAELTDRLFSGDVTALVSHLLEEQSIDADEVARLRELIERRSAEAGARDADGAEPGERGDA